VDDLLVSNFRALAAAILRRAAQDARLGDVDARRWLLFDPWAGDILDALGIERCEVRRWVLGL